MYHLLGWIITDAIVEMSKPKVLDPQIYEKAKKIVYAQYKKPSAYRSGALVKKYKELGGRYSGDKEKGGMTKWIREEWTDIAGLTYPVFRPTKRVSRNTPLTVDEIQPSNLIQQIVLKQRIRGRKNLPPFKAI